MVVEPFFTLFLPVVTVFVVALVGSARRLGFWITLILSVFLTPVGGFVAAVISGPRKRKPKPKPKRRPKRQRELLGGRAYGERG